MAKRLFEFVVFRNRRVADRIETYQDAHDQLVFGVGELCDDDVSLARAIMNALSPMEYGSEVGQVSHVAVWETDDGGECFLDYLGSIDAEGFYLVDEVVMVPW